MSEFICRLDGVRGRVIDIYDRKCVIETFVTAGSILTRNATDGEKTIFYKDCTGIQYKDSGLAIGYLQFETPSMQMNNKESNFFSENTFTFEDGKNDVTNSLMQDVYQYVVTRIEGYKYNDQELLNQDLPQRLALLYGKTRPLTKEERQQEAETKKEQRRLELEKQQKREEQIAEDIKSTSIKDADLIAGFMAEGSSCTKYRNLLDAWNQQGFEDNELYKSIRTELEQKASLERLYGGTTPNQIQAYLNSIKSKLGLNQN